MHALVRGSPPRAGKRLVPKSSEATLSLAAPLRVLLNWEPCLEFYAHISSILEDTARGRITASCSRYRVPPVSASSMFPSSRATETSLVLMRTFTSQSAYDLSAMVQTGAWTHMSRVNHRADHGPRQHRREAGLSQRLSVFLPRIPG